MTYGCSMLRRRLLALITALTCASVAHGADWHVQNAEPARARPMDLLFFLQGYGVDGVFAVTITLILARDASLASAVMGGSALLAMRHFGEAIAAPLFGWIADHFGARRVFIIATLLTIAGFLCIALGLTVFGALVMLLFRGALASLGPAVIASALSADSDAIGPLAQMQAWRDLGAACGPLITGALLAFVSAEVQLGVIAIALALALLHWYRAPIS